jgi:hypothetical protein
VFKTRNCEHEDAAVKRFVKLAITAIKLKSPEPITIKNKNNEKNKRNDDMTEIKKKNTADAIIIFEKMLEGSIAG